MKVKVTISNDEDVILDYLYVEVDVDSENLAATEIRSALETSFDTED